MRDRQSLTEFIKAEALRLGFDICGIAQARPIPPEDVKGYLQWIEKGYQANMGYMAQNIEKRLDPTLLVEGTKSIICVGMNYFPSREMEGYQIAWYAYGKDYHDVLKGKLFQLLAAIRQEIPEAQGRCFVDTAPIMERYWAEKAGLGWRGKNTQLIVPHQGSCFYLGELFLNLELVYDSPQKNHCGQCSACQDQCPAHALYMDSETHTPMLDASRCLSYQTIENKGEISEETQGQMGNRIYGCDQCQKACPHNHFAKPTTHPEFFPSEKLLDMKPEDWDRLTLEQYRILFKGSAVKRAKYEGLIRNIRAVKSNK